jgi:hypothetical protein
MEATLERRFRGKRRGDDRGLAGVRLVISDAHAGLVIAIGRSPPPTTGTGR